MTETIICALITGGLTLMGVLIANGKQQAITDTKLDELTREVREHNSFAQRVPVIEEQIKVINHRIQDLNAMENIKKRLGNLLAVKSLVTITLTVVFAVLALRESISGSEFLTIFTVVIGFYFGTQRVNEDKNS